MIFHLIYDKIDNFVNIIERFYHAEFDKHLSIYVILFLKFHLKILSDIQ